MGNNFKKKGILFHRQLNEDHRHRLDKYNDEEEQVEHQYIQHDKATK